MAEYVLELRNIGLSYDAKRVLHTASIGVRAGEFHALVGNHSEGKSSLCRIMAGILQPRDGQIVVAGQTHAELTMSQAAQLGIERIGKTITLFNHLTVGENIAIGEYRNLRRQWFGSKSTLNRIYKWQEWIGISLPLEKPLSALPPEDLGLIQILGKLYCRPRLLILDEALESLTQQRQMIARAALGKMMSEGMAVLWATHQLEEALKYSDTVSVLRYGKVFFTGEAGNIDKKTLVRLAYTQAADAFVESEQSGFYELLKNTEVVLRDLPLGIIIINREKKIQYVNDLGEQFFIGGETAAIGDDISVLLGNANERVLAGIDEAIAASVEIKAAIDTFFSTGGKCIISFQMRFVRDMDELVGYMLVFQDVSEQEEMRRQLILEHNLSSIGRLAAGVAHEVNNPLEIIGNYVRYMQKNPASNRNQEFLQEIQNEIDNIQRIVNNLVAFSGRANDYREQVDVFELASDVSGLINFGDASQRINIHCSGPSKPALINANSAEMRQILLNLIRNSMEAMPDGGDVYIYVVAEDDDKVWLIIRDNGPGILFDSVNDIFLPFASNKLGTGGNQGLGLSIVHGLVEKFRGVITVHNLEKGGCEFVLAFPRGVSIEAIT